MISSSGATPSQHTADTGTHAQSLTEADACSLLSGRGYELVKRVHHIHASSGGREWHLCLVADLPTLTPEQFLQRFEEALSFPKERLSQSLHHD